MKIKKIIKTLFTNSCPCKKCGREMEWNNVPLDYYLFCRHCNYKVYLVRDNQGHLKEEPLIMEKGKMNEEMVKEKKYKDFEELCKKQEIAFNDDRFNNAHLDSGNLFAFYSGAIKKCNEQKQEQVEELKKEMRQRHPNLGNMSYAYLIGDIIDKIFKGKKGLKC